MVLKIFISSVRNEFEEEGMYLKQKLMEDSNLNKYIEIFLFETDVESTSQAPPEIYINEVRTSDIYIGIIGSTYGNLTDKGISATELEYNEYSKLKSYYYFYVKNLEEREERTLEFLHRIQNEATYTTFDNKEELFYEVKRSLLSYINSKLSSSEFDLSIIDNSSINNVDINVYDNYFNILTDDALLSLKQYRNKEEILTLIKAGSILNNNFHLTNAGALFFSNDIEKFGIEHEIKMVRFQGEDRLTIIDYQESHAPIPILLDEVEKFFRRNTRHGVIVKDWGRVAIPEYPIDAIKEAIVNAIAHRDYTIVGDTITFYIYSNRIEIISPGRSLVPIEDLGNINPVHRNKALCNIFRYTKYMEHVGTGILRMKESMKNEGLSEPEFHNFTNNFRVTFYGRKNTEQLPLKLTNNDKIINLNELNLKDRQITALKMMLNNNYIFTTKKYIDKFKVSKSTAARDLNELVDKNLISKESDKRPILYLKK